jgi:hypothetical protein
LEISDYSFKSEEEVFSLKMEYQEKVNTFRLRNMAGYNLLLIIQKYGYIPQECHVKKRRVGEKISESFTAEVCPGLIRDALDI